MPLLAAAAAEGLALLLNTEQLLSSLPHLGNEKVQTSRTVTAECVGAHSKAAACNSRGEKGSKTSGPPSALLQHEPVMRAH